MTTRWSSRRALREVAVLEKEVPDLPRPDWNVDLRTERSGAPRATAKIGVIDLGTSGMPRGPPAVTRRSGLAESTYSASLPRVSGGCGARQKLSERIRTLARPDLYARSREMPRL